MARQQLAPDLVFATIREVQLRDESFSRVTHRPA
jgi:hypothetical protein